MKRIERICKPSSVRYRACGSAGTVIYLGQEFLPASSGQPRSIETGRFAPVFGLASGGVCLAEKVALSTGGLLHRRFTLAQTGTSPVWAVCFLWHFP